MERKEEKLSKLSHRLLVPAIILARTSWQGDRHVEHRRPCVALVVTSPQSAPHHGHDREHQADGDQDAHGQKSGRGYKRHAKRGDAHHKMRQDDEGENATHHGEKA